MLNFQVGHEVQITGPIVENSGRVSPPGDESGIDFVPFPNLLEKGNYDRRTRQAEAMMSWHSIRSGGSECELPIST